jgi:hypothetical protein
MRTSNKILIGFLILIFLVPVFVLVSFNSKIRKGEFTVVKSEQYEGADSRSGSFKPYKVVKIIAPPGNVLQVNLQHADTLHYGYHITSLDSVKVYNLADTLFIQYLGQPRANRSHTNEERFEDQFQPSRLHLDVQLPSVENLIIDNADVKVSTMDARGGNINAEIYGSGSLKIGETGNKDRDEKGGVKEETWQLQQLSVKNSGAELSVGKNVNIRVLKLDATGSAVIGIEDGAVIETMLGNLSDSSSVNANWKYVRRLALLTNN